MTGYLPACATGDVAEGTALGVVLAGCPVAVVRSGGTYYALRDVCSHANVALSEGEVVDGALECWLHGSMFDLATGRPTCLPATVPVPVYPVRVEGDQVLVAVPGATSVGPVPDSAPSHVAAITSTGSAAITSTGSAGEEF